MERRGGKKRTKCWIMTWLSLSWVMSGPLPTAASRARERDDEESIWWPASPSHPPFPLLSLSSSRIHVQTVPAILQTSAQGGARQWTVACWSWTHGCWPHPFQHPTPSQDLFSLLSYTKGAQGSGLEEESTDQHFSIQFDRHTLNMEKKELNLFLIFITNY